MQVFKLFFKILRENIPTLLVYFIITFISAILFVKVGIMNGSSTSEIKPSMVIENKSNSEYAQGLVDYLEQKCKVIDIDQKDIEDALFYREISYVLYIPTDFEEQLKNNQKVTFDVKNIPDTSDAYIAARHIESYMASLQTNIQYYPDDDTKTIVELSKQDLQDEVEITMLNKEGKEQVHFYLNFLGYTFCSCLIGGIGYAMYVMNKREIRRRNIVSPITNMSINLQQMLAFILYAVIMGATAILFAYLIFPSGMSEAFAPYMILNTFVSLVPALGLAYLIGTFVTSLEVQNGVSNVICLILAFVGGSFVPQEYLSEGLLRVGSFTPNYWFVKTNNVLYDIQLFDFDHLRSVYGYMGIQILFGIVFFLIALIYSKQKRKNVI